jgi:hypothetical protein
VKDNLKNQTGVVNNDSTTETTPDDTPDDVTDNNTDAPDVADPEDTEDVTESPDTEEEVTSNESAPQEDEDERVIDIDETDMPADRDEVTQTGDRDEFTAIAFNEADNASPSGLSRGAWAGIISGIVVGSCLCMSLCGCFLCKVCKRNKKLEGKEEEDAQTLDRSVEDGMEEGGRHKDICIQPISLIKSTDSTMSNREAIEMQCQSFDSTYSMSMKFKNPPGHILIDEEGFPLEQVDEEGEGEEDWENDMSQDEDEGDEGDIVVVSSQPQNNDDQKAAVAVRFADDDVAVVEQNVAGASSHPLTDESDESGTAAQPDGTLV